MNPLLEPARILRQQLIEAMLRGETQLDCHALRPLIEALREAEAQAETALIPPARPAFGQVHTEAEAARLLQTSERTLQRRRESGFYQRDQHYCWRAGRVVYSDKHLENILFGIGFEAGRRKKAA
ncbi:MAG TPA: hypothetical protein VNQ79_05340 [Blastocatellia bacterium]|nr:hypothetical protein [Blastocatellia bacterium]